jgi:hypothetical protein
MRSLRNARQEPPRIIEPMLQWSKVTDGRHQHQYVPCTAGNLTGVVRQRRRQRLRGSYSDRELASRIVLRDLGPPRAGVARSIRAKRCHCTGEIAMWPSVVFQPLQLAGRHKQAMAARAHEAQTTRARRRRGAGRRRAGGAARISPAAGQGSARRSAISASNRGNRAIVTRAGSRR